MPTQDCPFLANRVIAFRLTRMRGRTTVCRMEDPEVVAAIVAGDPAGLAEAYDRYAVPLYSYWRAMLPEPAAAADAVQDTFLVATAKLRGLRDPSKLRSWLYAVARNECMPSRRRGPRRRGSGEGNTLIGAMPADPHRPP